jgi:predicted porin
MKKNTASYIAAALALCIQPIAALASTNDDQKSAIIAQYRITNGSRPTTVSTIDEQKSSIIAQYRAADETHPTTASSIDDQKSAVIAQYRLANETRAMIADRSIDKSLGSFNAYLKYLGQRIRADAGAPGKVIELDTGSALMDRYVEELNYRMQVLRQASEGTGF